MKKERSTRPVGAARSVAGNRLGAGAIQPKRRGATSTVEDYLKCILMLEGTGAEERQHTVGMGSLGSELGVAPGTVTAMMKALGESGLVDYAPYTGVHLTDAGRTLATHVLRRHRLIELFLVEIMELDWSEVHGEAELLEHAISDRLIERMDEMLGSPTVDPHGDPIPSPDGRVAELSLASLLECPLHEPLQVVRVLDQSASFLRGLEAQGLVPGATVIVQDRGVEDVLLEVTRSNDRGSSGPEIPRSAQLTVEIAGKVEVQQG